MDLGSQRWWSVWWVPCWRWRSRSSGTWRALPITLAGGDSLLVASPIRPDSAFIDGMLRAAWWEDSVRLAIASRGPHGVDEPGHAAV